MPDVPRLPGVPPLLSYAANAITLLANDALAALLGGAPPEWGLFLDGVPVVVAESVVSFDFRQGWEVSDYPTEQGGFETYNKVNSPFDVRIRFASGTTEQARLDLLRSVEAIGPTLDLFDAVTPQAIYTSVNVTHYDYRRTSDRGVGLMSIDVWCKEVRVTAQQKFTSTKTPSGASPQNGGTVQPIPAPDMADWFRGLQ